MSSKEAMRMEFHDPEARVDYAAMFLDSSIALQIKALRLQRKWSQKELAVRAGMRQSRISAMEQADYSSWSIRTLQRLAKAFDLALMVNFESFGVLLESIGKSGRSAFERQSFSDDPAFKDEVSQRESFDMDTAGDVMGDVLPFRGKRVAATLPDKVAQYG